MPKGMPLSKNPTLRLMSGGLKGKGVHVSVTVAVSVFMLHFQMSILS